MPSSPPPFPRSTECWCWNSPAASSQAAVIARATAAPDAPMLHRFHQPVSVKKNRGFAEHSHECANWSFALLTAPAPHGLRDLRAMRSVR